MTIGNINERRGAKVSSPGRPLVSIVTICLNGGKYLEQAIQSVLNQTYDNIEYIIVDGGSTDKTLDIIKKYESRIDRWMSEPDKGIYDALNKAISLTSGDWVGSVNSDDWYEPDTVRLIVEAAAKNPESGVIFGDMRVHKFEDGQVVCYQVKGRVEGDGVLLENPLTHPTCFVAKRVYEQFRFNPAFRMGADYDLMARLYNSGAKFEHLDRILTNFRIGGTTSQVPYRILFEAYQIRSRYNRWKALRKLIYVTALFPLERLYLRLPWAFRKKYQIWKKDFVSGYKK